MEHSGDYLGALRRHTSATAERYGNLGAPEPTDDELAEHEAAQPAAHALDESEAESE